MERQGSGLEKILNSCKKSANFKDSFEPKFISDRTQFRVVFPNMNYSESKEQVIKLISVLKQENKWGNRN